MNFTKFTWAIYYIVWITCCFAPSEAYYDDSLFSNALIVRSSNNDTIQARMAAFGPRIGEEEGVNGILIPMRKFDKMDEEENNTSNVNVDDIINNKSNKYNYGCRKIINMERYLEKLDEKDRENIKNKGFIAMVERGGGCSFSQKVRNMQDSGAKAVIVGNNHGELRLITMYSSDDTSDIQIPSVFILQYDMYNLQDAAFEEIKIVEDYTDWSSADAFVMIVALPIAFLFGICIIYKFRIDAFEPELQNQSTVSLGAASQEEVDALPIKIFDLKKKKENDPDCCAICIDDFVDGDKLRVLPCRHEYHVECIDLWLTTRKRFCPICKRTIGGDEDEATENTPLLNHNNSNTYNTGEQNATNSNININSHIIDIDPELEQDTELEQDIEYEINDIQPNLQEEEDTLQPNENSNSDSNSDSNSNSNSNSDSDSDTDSDSDSDADDENEPLINIVNRSRS